MKQNLSTHVFFCTNKNNNIKKLTSGFFLQTRQQERCCTKKIKKKRCWESFLEKKKPVHPKQRPILQRCKFSSFLKFIHAHTKNVWTFLVGDKYADHGYLFFFFFGMRNSLFFIFMNKKKFTPQKKNSTWTLKWKKIVNFFDLALYL